MQEHYSPLLGRSDVEKDQRRMLEEGVKGLTFSRIFIQSLGTIPSFPSLGNSQIIIHLTIHLPASLHKLISGFSKYSKKASTAFT